MVHKEMGQDYGRYKNDYCRKKGAEPMEIQDVRMSSLANDKSTSRRSLEWTDRKWAEPVWKWAWLDRKWAEPPDDTLGYCTSTGKWAELVGGPNLGSIDDGAEPADRKWAEPGAKWAEPTRKGES